MNIITISREFGSGGRQLGRGIADLLGYDYYDKEIISQIAKNSGLDESYIESALSFHGWSQQLTIANTLASLGTSAQIQSNVELLREQTRVIEDIGKAGRNAVIIGRCADILLKDYGPFDIFVTADMDARIARCIERASEGEDSSPKAMKKQIQRIDRDRAMTRRLISDSEWGSRENYHLIVNTTTWEIAELAEAVAEFAARWFKRSQGSA